MVNLYRNSNTMDIKSLLQLLKTNKLFVLVVLFVVTALVMMQPNEDVDGIIDASIYTIVIGFLAKPHLERMWRTTQFFIIPTLGMLIWLFVKFVIANWVVLSTWTMVMGLMILTTLTFSLIMGRKKG